MYRYTIDDEKQTAYITDVYQFNNDDPGCDSYSLILGVERNVVYEVDVNKRLVFSQSVQSIQKHKKGVLISLYNMVRNPLENI